MTLPVSRYCVLGRANFLVCVLSVFALVAIGCGEQVSQRPPDKFEGIWESHSFTMTITRNDTGYLVDLDNHRGMLSGDYQGVPVADGLKVALPLAGDQLILISPAGDRLEFIGEDLVKVKPGESTGKSEKRLGKEP